MLRPETASLFLAVTPTVAVTSCACRLDGLQSEEEQAEEAEKAVVAKATAYVLVDYFVYLYCAGMTLQHMCSLGCTTALVLFLMISVPVVPVGALSPAPAPAV
jgi:hypothetical protein